MNVQLLVWISKPSVQNSPFGKYKSLCALFFAFRYQTWIYYILSFQGGDEIVCGQPEEITFCCFKMPPSEKCSVRLPEFATENSDLYNLFRELSFFAENSIISILQQIWYVSFKFNYLWWICFHNYWIAMDGASSLRDITTLAIGLFFHISVFKKICPVITWILSWTYISKLYFSSSPPCPPHSSG